MIDIKFKIIINTKRILRTEAATVSFNSKFAAVVNNFKISVTYNKALLYFLLILHALLRSDNKSVINLL